MSLDYSHVLEEAYDVPNEGLFSSSLLSASVLTDDFILFLFPNVSNRKGELKLTGLTHLSKEEVTTGL